MSVLVGVALRAFAPIILLLVVLPAANAEPVRIASKNFPENTLLAEVLSQLLEANGFEVERRFGLGGTLVCYEALVNDEVDLYVEYTGTLLQAILKLDLQTPTIAELNAAAPKSVALLDSFGFNNTYAVTLKGALAERLGIARVSDLVSHPDLVMAFSHEFMNRNDGWPGLKATYGLTGEPSSIDHGLGYLAIDEGKIDITHAYSTDGDLERYRLITLEDDKRYFPEYLAAPLVRSDLPEDVKAVIGQLAGRLDDPRMRGLNAQVVIHEREFADVAREFLIDEGLIGADVAPVQETSMWRSIASNTLTHLKLTAIALVAGIGFGVPLGVLVFRNRRLSRVLVYVAGLLQTIPSMALLALMIPIFSIGMKPAIVALFLYSLLPILRSTTTALVTIDPVLKRVAEAIGLTNRQQLLHILIPMAMPNILTGVKTAAIISIGTATLAAYIGAGGLGDPIFTGLSLNNTNLILQGALPAAALAVVVELMFEGLERLLVKEHMLTGRLPD